MRPIWASQPDKRDVYLTSKNSLKESDREEDTDALTGKVVQVKYTGDEKLGMSQREDP